MSGHNQLTKHKVHQTFSQNFEVYSQTTHIRIETKVLVASGLRNWFRNANRSYFRSFNDVFRMWFVTFSSTSTHVYNYKYPIHVERLRVPGGHGEAGGHAPRSCRPRPRSHTPRCKWSHLVLVTSAHLTFLRGNPWQKWPSNLSAWRARGRSGPHVERIWANPSQPLLRKVKKSDFLL